MAFHGVNPTKEQKIFHDRLAGKVGCICCRHHGVFNDYVSIHHISGRSKPDSHWYVLPLCAGHHQKGSNTDHPEILAIHGDKAAWQAKYGTEEALWLECFSYLEWIPDGIKKWLKNAQE